ncbi:unnamed protein product [Cylindrotheca closterium]|uniref:NAD(P)-binding domain-containing protein n=1 Tax=Cylindrotheca closterium TaxID=2856 RepID=A0AAD2G1V5_9STRA|nr:unnamed protein product [Cylindrotheca closterium]
MRTAFLLSLLPCALAFSSSLAPMGKATSALHSLASEDEASSFSRREAIQAGVASATTLAGLFVMPQLGIAEEETRATSIKNVVVAGATGQTGSRVFERLVAQNFVTTGGVRNVAKASKSLQGNLKQLDVVEDSIDSLTETLKGADGLIIACGMNPGKNLLRMSAAAHEVDNIGTCKLISAAKNAGVKKVVMVSSILTDGRAWGQENSPGFVATNAFGGALDEKLVSEKFLRASGLDYTIVRPGGLKAKAPTGELSINPENTLNSGEISRDLVADVSIACLNDPEASNKVLEIFEDEEKPAKVFNGLVM